MVTGTVIAVETMVCRVDIDLGPWLGRFNLVHLRQRYVRIVLTEVHHDRALGLSIGLGGHAATIVRDCGGEPARLAGGSPGQQAAEAVAHHPDAAVHGRSVDGRLHVLQRQFVVQLLKGKLYALSHIGFLVAEFQAPRHPIEDLRRDRQVTVRRVAVRHLADVVVDAEDFLDHHHRTFWRSDGIGAVRAQREAVHCPDLYLLAHSRLLRLSGHETVTSALRVHETVRIARSNAATLQATAATPMTANTILLVEDEPEIRDMLSFTLGRAGFQVWEAGTAEEAAGRLEGLLPSLLIVDWMLPGMSGIEFARRVRRDEHTRELPIIMLTAKGEEVDKLKSFESGIDDYVTKPFSPRELIARVKALLRRSGSPESGIIQHGALLLNLAAHQLTVDGQAVPLGPTEFRLLEHFMTHPGRAFDRSQLLDRVWGRSVYVEERTVDVHILRLRKALAPYDLQHLVQTVRGVGYRYLQPE